MLDSTATNADSDVKENVSKETEACSDATFFSYKQCASIGKEKI